VPTGHDLRCFVALLPPAPVAQALAAGMAGAQAGAGFVPPRHRLIPESDLHLTLVFIGTVRAKELRSVRESVERSCAGVPGFDLALSRIITIPTPDDGGPPRLLAATGDASATPPGLLEVQRRLATRLTEPKRNGRRGRFLPHVTLMRYAHEAGSDALDAPLPAPVVWPVRQVCLMSSRLDSASGHARYDVVHAVDLDEP
jgi:2'-5' RNA ligase